MKRKLCFIASMILSTSLFANVISEVHVDPLTQGRLNTDEMFFTRHTYSIVNDSGVAQHYTICYTTMLCATAALDYHKTLHSCEDFVLQSGESKHDTKITKLPYNYPFVGYCDADATTQIVGWQGYIAGSSGKLRIS